MQWYESTELEGGEGTVELVVVSTVELVVVGKYCGVDTGKYCGVGSGKKVLWTW